MIDYNVQLCNLRGGSVSKKVRKSVTLVNAIDCRFIFCFGSHFLVPFKIVQSVKILMLALSTVLLIMHFP